MPKKYSEQFKMQVAYDYFVDRCSVNALCDKYKLTVHTVRYFYKNRRGEYRDAIFRNWKDEEKRLRRAVFDYLSGGSAEEVAQEYNICTQWLLKLVDMRFNSYLIEPPKFTAEELAKPKAFVCVNDMAQEILKLDVQHCPLYGIRDATTGKWLQRLFDNVQSIAEIPPIFGKSPDVLEQMQRFKQDYQIDFMKIQLKTKEK